jgi:hypothetical protein
MQLSTRRTLVAAVIGTLFIGIGTIRVAVDATAEETAIQLADLSPADAIAKRQQVMKDQGSHMKAINEFVESGSGTAADVAKHAEALKASSALIAELFPAGTSIDDNIAKTAAKKEGDLGRLR